jgi:hypothetical protein
VGLLIVFVLMYVVSRRASGHLPLTKMSSRTIALASWIPAGLLIGTVLLWVVAAIVGSSSNDPTASSAAGRILILSLLTLGSGGVGWLIVRPIVGQRATVMEQQPGYYDRIVELRSVHPAFVAAVIQTQQARAAQYAAAISRTLPPPPGST